MIAKGFKTLFVGLAFLAAGSAVASEWCGENGLVRLSFTEFFAEQGFRLHVDRDQQSFCRESLSACPEEVAVEMCESRQFTRRWLTPKNREKCPANRGRDRLFTR